MRRTKQLREVQSMVYVGNPNPNRDPAYQRAFDVCYALDSGAKADIVGGSSRARSGPAPGRDLG